jgi:hypothetical protein
MAICWLCCNQHFTPQRRTDFSMDVETTHKCPMVN